MAAFTVAYYGCCPLKILWDYLNPIASDDKAR